MELKGKVAIVTGAARGLGKCAVEELLVRGVKVCFCDVNIEEGEATLREFVERFGEGNVMFKACDVCKENEIKDLIEETKKKFQGFDILINNAAIVDDKLWEKMVDVNLGGYIRSTRLAIEYLRKDKGGNGGVILNVSSVAGFVPQITEPCYAATKHAILGFSKSLALQQHVKENGIRIVCLCPNAIDTPLLRQVLDNTTGNEKLVLEKLLSKIGLLSMKTVVEGIIKGLQDEDNNAKELYVDATFGIGYRSVSDPVGDKFMAAQML